MLSKLKLRSSRTRRIIVMILVLLYFHSWINVVIDCVNLLSIMSKPRDERKMLLRKRGFENGLKKIMATSSSSSEKAYLQKLADLGEKCGDKLLIVNIHIPKTGGTTVSEALKQCAWERNMRFAYGHYSSFSHMPAKKKERVFAIDAHMGYGIHLQQDFPEDRKDCTVYITFVRPLVDVLYSSYRYNYHFQTTAETLEEYKESWINYKGLTNPWSYKGSVSYQLCCYHDFQHEKRSDFDAFGNYKTSKLPKNQENYTTVYNDPNCPQSFEERAECATKRLCDDFLIVGDLTNKDSIARFYRQLGALTQCDITRFIPTDKKEGVRKQKGREFPPYDIDILSKVLGSEGANYDSFVMEYGKKVANNRDFCMA